MGNNSVIQAVLNACANDGADLVTVQFLGSANLSYFTPAAHNTVTDLKHAIRQIHTHAGRGLRIIQTGAPVADDAALNNTTYHCIYAIGNPPDATLVAEGENSDDDDDDDDDVEVILNDAVDPAVLAHPIADDDYYPYSDHR
ncbi:MAG TPA: hypothetical protein VH250_10450 [Granulicella sp.]|nr:hypothetical protein [Granulicella sp.]